MDSSCSALGGAFNDGDFVVGQFIEFVNEAVKLAFPPAHVRLRVGALDGEDAAGELNECEFVGTERW